MYALWLVKDPKLLHADSEDYQSARRSMLICLRCTHMSRHRFRRAASPMPSGWDDCWWLSDRWSYLILPVEFPTLQVWVRQMYCCHMYYRYFRENCQINQNVLRITFCKSINFFSSESSYLTNFKVLHKHFTFIPFVIVRAASSEFGTYRLYEQRRFRRACASAQSRQNLRCSLIQAVSQEEPSDRKPDP